MNERLRRLAPTTTFFFLIGALWAAAPAPPQASPPAKSMAKEIPKTPAGKRLAELLEVINSGKRETFRSYIAANFDASFLQRIPLDEHVNVFSRTYDVSRGYDFYGLQESSENAVRAFVRNRLTGGWEVIMVRVKAEAPHAVEGLGIRNSPPPPDFPAAKKLRPAEFAPTLDAVLAKIDQADALSGSVLVDKDGQILFFKAYGLASREFNVPNRPDTKFNLGSMNKMFTAVAVAQLVEKGQLAYDDLIGKYLGSDWIKEETGSRVKIRHLLSHTSGLGSYFNEKFQKSSRLLFRKVDDYKPLVADDKPEFEPGTKWRYSNTGFLLLGAIIEKVTGRSYFDCVRENIFAPAGMANTDSYEMDRPNPNLAIGYMKEYGDQGPSWRNNIFDHVVKGGPAGGGFSTAEDLLKFAAALRSNKLVSAESRELLLSAKPELNSPDYGYGFDVRKEEKLGRVAGHSGGFPGISSILQIYLDSGYTVVALTNYGVGSQMVSLEIQRLLAALE